ncbi:MAG TPA: aminoacetone oxidase family FAD-binding enzyme [Flavobacteriales bacterium]|nr:aminoacetone oxidase family FAD-binding enzyme [Flavobacteriales bacterium]
MRVVVIGGGAAGFFAALSVVEHHPRATVVLLEKSDKLLSKVRISGGGRCNVTHACFEPRKLAGHYPRGERFLRKAFERFQARHTVEWFADRGVQLKAEADGRMFPITDDSATIVDCLTKAARHGAVEVRLRTGVRRIHPGQPGKGFRIALEDGSTITADRVITTTGGHPKPTGYDLLSDTGHTLVPPVPSLFTFNMPEEPIKELMGVTVPAVTASIAGSKLSSTGPLLITHWGMSGPAILRLSAWGAREIAAMNYTFTLRVDWTNGLGEQVLRERIEAFRAEHAPREPVSGGTAEPVLAVPVGPLGAAIHEALGRTRPPRPRPPDRCIDQCPLCRARPHHLQGGVRHRRGRCTG